VFIANNQLKKQFFKNLSTASVLSIASMALLYLSQVLTARYLGIEQFGIYYYVLSWLSIAVLLGKFGLDATLQRFLPEYLMNAKWSLCRGLLLGSFKIGIVASTVIVLIGLITVTLFRQMLGNTLFITLIIGMLIIPIWVANKITQGSLIALKKPALSIIPDGLILPGCLVISFAVFYQITGHNISAPTAILIHAILLTFTLIVSLIFLSRYSLAAQIKISESQYKTREWLNFSFPLLFISGTQLVLNHADIIMIGLFIDTTHSGIYAAASRISSLVTVGLLFINMILTPYISEFFYNNRKSDLQELVTYSTRLASVIAVPIFFILIFYGDSILWLFGETFTIGHQAMIILCIGTLFNVFSGSVGFLMSMTGHQKQSAYIFSMGCILNIFLNIILIPTYGIEGAAIATAISMIFWNFSLAAYLKIKININSTIITH
jgi:O-antigen/teichoic acid export membrane protein